MQLRFENVVLDLGRREIRRRDEAIPVTPKAFQLLELLVRKRPDAVSKDTLHQSLWPDAFVVDGNLANLVSELREALGDDARHPRMIRTVQRFGYAFQAEARGVPAEKPAGASALSYRLLWGEREIALAEGENLIGRDQDASVFVDDVSVSRHHARIVIDDTGASLEDLGSKNGTYLAGKKVESRAALSDGESIRLGSVALVFRRFETGGSTESVSSRPG